MLKNSYIVDVGLNTFKSAKFNSSTQNGQELFCRCSGRLEYNQKVKRDILIVNTPVYQADYDLESIACPYCGEVYDKNNPIKIILPDYGELFEINFFLKKQTLSNGNHLLRLIKVRRYAHYDSTVEHPELKELSIYDELNYNLETQEVNVFINNSQFSDSYTGFLLKNNSDLEKESITKSMFEQNVSCNISFGTLNKIKQFFYFDNEVNYSNLELCFHFLKKISESLIDFGKIINSSHIYIASFCENFKIELEKIEKNNKIIYKRFIYVEDEFSFSNEKVREQFNSGSYISAINSMAFSIFSILSYNNIITIFLTKDYKFFESFVKSDTIVNPNVLKFHGATYPSKIFEICANFKKNGQKKRLSKQLQANLDEQDVIDQQTDISNYLKFSNIIYNNIFQPKDINKLKSFAEKGYLSKLQLENLFQKYNKSILYTVFGFLGDSDKKELIDFRHVEHIIRYELFEEVGVDFLNVYCDTIKIINDITRTQSAVIKHIETHKNISKSERESLSVYLAIKDNQIFEIKTGKDLKNLHDNLAILYSVFQDATKVEAYAIAVEKFDSLNCEIDFFTFEVIPSAYELQREHKVMKHCINTYIDRIIRGNYLAVRVVDQISNEHSTLGLVIDQKQIRFDQLKSYQNSRSSPFLIRAVLDFFVKHKIDSSNGSKFDIVPDGDKSMRDSRKEVLPLDKCQEFRIELMKNQDINKPSKEKSDEEIETEKKSLNESIENFKNKLILINN